jgi:pilus assembly protein CpaB
MLTNRTLVLFTVALLLAVLAVFIARRWVETLQPGVVPQAQTVPVVVAALEIPYLQKINATQIKTIDWPKGSAPSGGLSDPAQVIGKISTQTVYPGEIILEQRLRDHLGGSPLAMVIAPNMRAVAVRVNDVSGVGGFLLPGNRVDVLASRKAEGSNATVRTETIIQDLKVLAVDQEASQDKDKPVVVKAVTLEMTPAQAEIVVKADEEGTLQLSLRNPTDQKVWAQVKPAEPPKPPTVVAKASVPMVHPITMLRGTASVTVKCGASGCSEAY